jgi:hypothetical protein
MKKQYIYWAIGLAVVYFLYTKAEASAAASTAAQSAANQGSDFQSELEGAVIGGGIGAATDYFDNEGF